ncbi:MAG TPA: hypothetical protein VIE43_05235 [Thermoanaerobaculia bacterium]|jgi:hypothetical protein|nr:hypothetical protein [Thermoanaerobaculia bacterium]
MNKKQLVEEARLLREARTQVFLSYGQKLFLVMIACCGFAMLQWLGEQKDKEGDFRKIRWQGRPDVVTSVVNQTTLDSSSPPANAATGPCPTVIGSAPSYFASRETMIAGMQELAAACIWSNFRRTIKNATSKLEEAGENPEVDKFTHFADYIAKEEALATITAKVAQQQVAARLIGMKPEPSKHSIPKAVGSRNAWQNVTTRLSLELQQAAGDDSNLYVFYEMLWYASLLMGVIASSILFMVLLHALPLTSGEGYWTARIAEILKRIPASSVVAVPLVAAAIGGGTLVGAGAATVPGGQARETLKSPAVSETAPPSTSRPSGKPGTPPRPPGPPDAPGGTEICCGGNSTTTIFNGWGDLASPPAGVSLKVIESSLATLNSSSRQLIEEARLARQSAILFYRLGRKPPQSPGTEPTAAELLQRMNTLTTQQEELGKRMDRIVDLKQLTQQIGTMAATMSSREAKADELLRSVKEHGDFQELLSAQSLGQTAAIDPRGFFARTFGKSYYAVGPLVPSIMDAKLKDVAGDAERKALVDLLKEMRKEHPCPEGDFRERIRSGLKIRLKPEKVDNIDEVTESLMRDHVPALLKICELPRY